MKNQNTSGYRFFEFVWPSIDFITDEALFYHKDGFCFYDNSKNELEISGNSIVAFDSYFNSISVAKYRNYTTIEDLVFEIVVSGRCKINAKHVSIASATIVLAETSSSGQRTGVKLPVSQWQALKEGLLFLELVAAENCQLHYVAVTTSSTPKRRVALGIAITHFNRQAYVVAAIERISKFISAEKGRDIQLLVVDNSRNLEPGEHFAATVVPNRNLGGAGGFARAMLHARETGTFTHLLFMDDDASCSLEALRRTYDLLLYANNDKMAVAGAMLLETAPHIQHEAGAIFDEYCVSLNHNVDVSVARNVLAHEAPQRMHYGAWWFFGFPLKDAGLPYPFFVRGDDVDFGLRNRFQNVTVNGICALQPAFARKDGPLSRYLDTRHQLAHYFNGHLRLERRKIFRICIRSFWHAALTYRYETAEAGLRALSDMLVGPSVFEHDPEASSARADLKANTRIEVHRKVDVCDLIVEYRHQNAFWLKRILRNITFCGHLLPTSVFRSSVRFQTGYDASGQVFGYRRVLYSMAPGSGYIAEIDQFRGLRIITTGLWRTAKMLCYIPAIQNRFLQRYAHLTSQTYWRDALGLDD